MKRLILILAILSLPATAWAYTSPAAPVAGFEYDGAGTLAMADLGTYYQFLDTQDAGSTSNVATYNAGSDCIDIAVSAFERRQEQGTTA